MRPTSLEASVSGSERWEDISSGSEAGEYREVENEVGARWEDEIDPEILRGVEKIGVVGRSPDMMGHTPPSPPGTQNGMIEDKGENTWRAQNIVPPDEDDTVVLAPTSTSTTARSVGKVLPSLPNKRATLSSEYL
ncbi:hypothetical protein RSOLAG22IIIB_11676 [Rhizoctonia solani]|uniref:Uncharacterized protein n=1 Tax=Rhizoctonia solani TaxID=456999 RepID=A0A0K6GAE9_9AGAM|nr:hypothetical protein RSOLAG22IIIB_11676 [Rhizoctonia solani]